VGFVDGIVKEVIVILFTFDKAWLVAGAAA